MKAYSMSHLKKSFFTIKKRYNKVIKPYKQEGGDKGVTEKKLETSYLVFLLFQNSNTVGLLDKSTLKVQ
jgi:hypothetical protein